MIIYKYPLPQQPATLDIPWSDGARPLCVQLQDGIPTLWVAQGDDNPPDRRRVFGIFTGIQYPIIKDGQYLGTVQLLSGLVMHYFLL